MSIEKIRSEHEQGFGRLDMKTIKDPRLTYAEVGLLLRLINLPEDWKYTEAGMGVAYPADGITALRSCIRGLMAAGYVQIRRERDERGRYGQTHLIIYERSRIPYIENPNLENPRMENPRKESPNLENPRVGYPAEGKP